MAAKGPKIIPKNSLVTYKLHPARVISGLDKIEIELGDGATKTVRPKDVMLLHPGPIESLEGLNGACGELEAAWELLAGTTTRLEEVADLAFGDFTPAAAWATWLWVMDGLYFSGTPDELVVHSADQVAEERAEREAREQREIAWLDFVDRARTGTIQAGDEAHLKEVEALALGQTNRSRLLKELGLQVTREQAHRLLLKLGVWDALVNPHPSRLHVAVHALPPEPMTLSEEPRRDLTHLPAFAIDDHGNQDPDDAVSLDGDRIWVHVADVAAVITPQSRWDVWARERGTTLYLPEKTVPMLPPDATDLFGLGLSHLSPALSFGIDFNEAYGLRHVDVTPSWIRVTRLDYQQADAILDREPLATLRQMLAAYSARRLAQGATLISLPEAKIRVEEGQVTIESLPRSASRNLVTEAMVLAGESAAKFALQNGLHIPFTAQPPPEQQATERFVMDTSALEPTMAEMFALRKHLKPSQTLTSAQPHWGLGLEHYARATSPLRRYQDLVVHQQLRALISGSSTLTPEEITQRVGAVEAVTSTMRQAERLSNQHWRLVYLLQQPQWRGTGVVVDRRGRRGQLIIPDLAMEIQMNLADDVPLNAELPLDVASIDLPTLTARFKAATEFQTR